MIQLKSAISPFPRFPASQQARPLFEQLSGLWVALGWSGGFWGALGDSGDLWGGMGSFSHPGTPLGTTGELWQPRIQIIKRIKKIRKINKIKKCHISIPEISSQTARQSLYEHVFSTVRGSRPIFVVCVMCNTQSNDS